MELITSIKFLKLPDWLEPVKWLSTSNKTNLPKRRDIKNKTFALIF